MKLLFALLSFYIIALFYTVVSIVNGVDVVAQSFHLNLPDKPYVFPMCMTNILSINFFSYFFYVLQNCQGFCRLYYSILLKPGTHVILYVYSNKTLQF